MTTLTSYVQATGPMRRNPNKSVLIETLQHQLNAAGYRIGDDGYFGPRTEQVVRRFQEQHGLKQTGIVDISTAAKLDQKPASLVIDAKPIIVSVQDQHWPHDDTASLVDFYGDPREGLEDWKTEHVTTVRCPWTLFYEGKRWSHPIQFHKRAADAFAQALNDIWKAAGEDDQSSMLKHVRNFSGSGEFRTVRGSSRLSCHAFWSALDFDAEHLPMNHQGIPVEEMPEEIVRAFLDAGAFWGGNYTGRKDPMHFQWAHE